MSNVFKWLIVALVPLFGLTLNSCSNDDEPALPSGVTDDKQETFITCFNSNDGELPSYAVKLYEDSEYLYYIAARNPKYELIILPYYKRDGEWIPAYEYDRFEEVGKQLTSVRYAGDWLCSLQKYPYLAEASLENMRDKLDFDSYPNLSVAPFNYRGCYYGYLTVEGGRKVNVKLFCSFLKFDRT